MTNNANNMVTHTRHPNAPKQRLLTRNYFMPHERQHLDRNRHMSFTEIQVFTEWAVRDSFVWAYIEERDNPAYTTTTDCGSGDLETETIRQNRTSYCVNNV